MTEQHATTGVVAVAHLGAHKTATSLVQSYFKRKQGHLRDQGLLALTRGDVSPFIEWGGEVAEDPSRLNGYLHDRAAEAGLPHLLFSNENTLGRPFTPARSGLYPDHRRVLEALPRALEGFVPRIVYSIRPQWEFVESYYLQLIHQGDALKFSEFLERLDFDQLSWRPMVDDLKATFGAENVVILDFGLIRSGAQAFLGTFLRRSVGREVAVDPDFEEVRNPSISARGLKIALRVNPLLRREEKKDWRVFMQTRFSNLQDPRPKLLTEEQRDDLKARYADEYAELVAG